MSRDRKAFQEIASLEAEAAGLAEENRRLRYGLGTAAAVLRAELDKEAPTIPAAVGESALTLLDQAVRGETYTLPGELAKLTAQRDALDAEVLRRRKEAAQLRAAVEKAWQELRSKDYAAANHTLDEAVATTGPACSECGTTTKPRSACPGCKKVFCQRCAETPYAFCCDGEGGPVDG
jgi:rubrerythrin